MYWEDCTITDAARLLGVSVVWASRTHQAALEALRKMMSA
jgi:DNA-directed RNA polymerase specialized sigma subunit